MPAVGVWGLADKRKPSGRREDNVEKGAVQLGMPAAEPMGLVLDQIGKSHCAGEPVCC